MKVNVVGKREMKGKSRQTGRDYHFISVSYVYHDPQVEGFGVGVVNLNPQLAPFASIKLQKDYAIDFDQSGRVLDFLPL